MGEHIAAIYTNYTTGVTIRNADPDSLWEAIDGLFGDGIPGCDNYREAKSEICRELESNWDMDFTGKVRIVAEATQIEYHDNNDYACDIVDDATEVWLTHIWIYPANDYSFDIRL